VKVISEVPCPRCGQNTFFRELKPHALVPTTKNEHGEPVMYFTEGFPVRPWFCRTCSYVELRYEMPIELD
jgi:hypothetical protein